MAARSSRLPPQIPPCHLRDRPPRPRPSSSCMSRLGCAPAALSIVCERRPCPELGPPRQESSLSEKLPDGRKIVRESRLSARPGKCWRDCWRRSDYPAPMCTSPTSSNPGPHQGRGPGAIAHRGPTKLRLAGPGSTSSCVSSIQPSSSPWAGSLLNSLPPGGRWPRSTGDSSQIQG